MKKITFLICVFISTISFSQVVLEDFESGFPPEDFNGFSGLEGVPSLTGAPGTDGGVVSGQIITNEAGNPWQGANLLLQDNYLDLTSDKTMTLDVYSDVPFSMLARTAAGQAGAVDSASDATHTGNGWETLNFDFTEQLDGTLTANGEYRTVAFFPLWDDAANGWSNSNEFGPHPVFTIFIDNLTGVAGSAVILPPEDPEPAPIPTSPNGETFSVYNDTNSYTTFFTFDYDFGTLGGEPDLDPGVDVNLAYKFDFGFAGYGVGEGPDDVSGYDFVSFDYWVSDPTPGFRFVLISNAGAIVESSFQVGTNSTLVTGEWTKVVIPMSYFTNLGFADTNLFQWKADGFNGTTNPNSIVYIDNILMTVQSPLSVDEFDAAKFSAYPNPTKDNWNISSGAVINTISIFDILGKRVITLSPNTEEAVVDASSLKSGMYFAKIESANGVSSLKLVKQ